MNYCTIEDLSYFHRSVLENWIKENKNANNINEQINNVITRTTNEMNLYISKQYSLPLNHLPILLQSICIDLSIFYLTINQINYKDNIFIKHSEAINNLEYIASGKLNIDFMGVPKKNTIYKSGPTILKVYEYEKNKIEQELKIPIKDNTIIDENNSLFSLLNFLQNHHLWIIFCLTVLLIYYIILHIITK